MTTIHDFIDQSNPFLTVPEKFQVGVYTVTAEVYGNDYEQFPIIHVTSYEPFLVTPDVELTGDIVLTEKGELAWASRVQISVDGGNPIPFDVASYDLPEIAAQARIYLKNLASIVWTNDVGYRIIYAIHNKLVHPISIRLGDVSRKLTKANGKIEEVEQLIASLPELIAARDALVGKTDTIRGEHRAAEVLYNEKVKALPLRKEGDTEIIEPASVFADTKIVQEAVAKKKRWFMS